jgi:pyrroloquinoline quinone biosynthesis protein B
VTCKAFAVRIIVLGSAAGGGVPQWNCNGPVSRAARAGSFAAPARMQASLAVSADGKDWVVINASPDLRQQILATPRLWPVDGKLRDTPIKAVVLTGGEIDNVAGLLSLRERQPFVLWATAGVHAALDANPIFEALDRALVERRALALDRPTALAGPGGALGLSLEAFSVPGKVPLYMESRSESLAGRPDGTIGLAIEHGRQRFHFIPGCAAMNPQIRRRITDSQLLFFDGTLWRDDEMITSGLGTKTGQRMGHLSMSGPEGSMALLADVPLGRRVFIHVNNSNPALLADSAERKALAAAGWEVAHDGMEIEL